MATRVAVFGATGLQGGSVVRALLADSTSYSVRAITRNTTSATATALQQQGCEVVKGDLDDPASVAQALKGVDACFLVTDFWHHLDQQKEIQQGRNAVDAAKSEGVKRVVFSGLEHVMRIYGKPCGHMDSKGQIEEYLAASGVPFTSVRVPFYYENFMGATMPRKQEDGFFHLGIPMGDTPFDAIAVSQIGPCVRYILGHADQFLGKYIGLCGQKMTGNVCAEILSTQLAPLKFVHDSQLTPAQYANFGFPGAEDLAAMFDFLQYGNPDRDLELTMKMNPDVDDFNMWVTKHKEELINAISNQ